MVTLKCNLVYIYIESCEITIVLFFYNLVYLLTYSHCGTKYILSMGPYVLFELNANPPGFKFCRYFFGRHLKNISTSYISIVGPNTSIQIFYNFTVIQRFCTGR